MSLKTVFSMTQAVQNAIFKIKVPFKMTIFNDKRLLPFHKQTNYVSCAKIQFST